MTPELPHGYGYRRTASASVVARAEDLDFVLSAIGQSGSLILAARAHGERTALYGRGRIYRLNRPSGRAWLIRRLAHGGLLAPLTGGRFLNRGVPRPFNELLLASRLTELGVATPQVAAAVVYRHGPWYAGEVARLEISGGWDLARGLFSVHAGCEADQRRLMAVAARLIRAAHDAGLDHPDLNLRNILIVPDDRPPRAFIIDLEKCRLRPRLADRSRRRMLKRLRHSARRLEEQNGSRLGPRVWEAFDASYGGEDVLH